MGSRIQIISEQSQIVPGQKTPVRVLIHFDKPTKVRGIRALFHGAERTEADYTTTTTDSEGRTRTETKTAVSYVDICKEQHLLQGDERMGFFSRIGDSLATWVGGGKHEVVEAGDHEFTLNVEVPANAPASFKGKKCSVFYRVEVSVDIPIRIDWSETLYLEVPPEKPTFQETSPVHVVFPDEQGRSFWDKMFGKPVTLNLAVDRDTLATGDSALAMLTVASPEPLQLKKIDKFLVGQESSRAQGYTDSYSYRIPLGEINSPGVITEESVYEFEIKLPEIDAPISQSGTNFEIQWFLEVRLYLPWAKDPTIRVPVRIV